MTAASPECSLCKHLSQHVIHLWGANFWAFTPLVTAPLSPRHCCHAPLMPSPAQGTGAPCFAHLLLSKFQPQQSWLIPGMQNLLIPGIQNLLLPHLPGPLSSNNHHFSLSPHPMSFREPTPAQPTSVTAAQGIFSNAMAFCTELILPWIFGPHKILPALCSHLNDLNLFMRNRC